MYPRIRYPNGYGHYCQISMSTPLSCFRGRQRPCPFVTTPATIPLPGRSLGVDGCKRACQVDRSGCLKYFLKVQEDTYNLVKWG